MSDAIAELTKLLESVKVKMTFSQHCLSGWVGKDVCQCWRCYAERIGQPEDHERMKWFGKSWNAPVCDPRDHITTPVGKPCFYCKESIEENDSGLMHIHIGDTARMVPEHYECFLRGIIGSVSHIEKTCSCYFKGSTENDPPGMSLREAARAAVIAKEAYEKRLGLQNV